MPPATPAALHTVPPLFSFLGLVGLQALQLLPDGRNVPESRESSGSEWKAGSPGLTVVVKHPLVLLDVWSFGLQLSVIAPPLSVFSFFPIHNVYAFVPVQ